MKVIIFYEILLTAALFAHSADILPTKTSFIWENYNLI